MITREEIENIALLSKLYVAQEENESITQDLEKMMEFAQVVSDAKVEDICISDPQETSPLREDEVRESLPAEDVLHNAPLSCGGYFTVEKNG